VVLSAEAEPEVKFSSTESPEPIGKLMEKLHFTGEKCIAGLGGGTKVKASSA
jgi:hypothetical protein